MSHQGRHLRIKSPGRTALQIYNCMSLANSERGVVQKGREQKIPRVNEGLRALCLHE